MSFKIWSIDKPMYLRGVLPFFQSGATFTSSELAKITPTVGLSDSGRRIRRLTQSWHILGILDRVREQNQAYRYSLSEFGENLLNKLQFNSSLAMEFVHWAYYSAWLRSPDFQWGWSWVYQEVCDVMWDSSPSQIVPRKLMADTLEKANSLFREQTPSFDIASIRSVMAWLAAMDPPFLLKKDESDSKSPLLSRKRESCGPELVFLAIQLQYQTKALSFGAPLLMDEALIEAVCKVCMLAPEQFWPMAEICSLTFPSLERKETLYGTSLMITEAAPFTPPEPRPLKASPE